MVHLWSQGFGDNSIQSGSTVAVDGSGNVIIVGSFYGTLDFGGGGLTGLGGYDVYLAKFDPGGNHIWSKSFGDWTTDTGYGVAVDGSGNIVINGGFRGNVDFGGGALTSAGDVDIFVAKFDPCGNHLWSQGFGDAYRQSGTRAAFDSGGNAYSVGAYAGTVDFGGGELTSGGSYDAYLVKFDPAGNHLWSKSFGGAYVQAAEAVAMDGSDNVIITGFFEQTIDFGGGTLTSAGSNDIFVAKFDASGNHLWSERFGDSDVQQATRGVAVDGSDNIIVPGYFKGNVDFGGGALASAGGWDVFVVKFNTTGGHLWSRRFGDGSDQTSYGITVDNAGSVTVTGSFGGSVDFGGGVLSSAGNRDVYLAKFDASGNHLWSERFGDLYDQAAISVAADGSGNVFAAGQYQGSMDFGGGWLPSGGNWDIYLAKFGGTPVSLDIKPRSCPNPLNITVFEDPPPNAKSKKGGVLPVAVLAEDVSEIDVSSLLLEGVAPIRHDYEDVTAPVQNGDECACTNAGPDGIVDLTLKFWKSEIAAAIGPVSDGGVAVLTITGELVDGTPFEASDCVLILSKRPELPSFAGPDKVIFKPAVPNPFNPVTRISYYLPREEFVELSVYDVTGELLGRLVSQVQSSGEHVVEWNAKGFSSGVYICRIKVGDFTETRKLILLK